jgi:hypothetical protein
MMGKLAPGDRVAYEAHGDFVVIGEEWWPGRIGYVLGVDDRAASVLWEEGSTSVLSFDRLRLIAPERFCQMCFRNVYLAHGAQTGRLMEWVPDSEGEVTLIGGRAVSLDSIEADRQVRRRKMMRANEEINRLVAHWRICAASPKYLGVPFPRDSRRTPTGDHTT